MHNCTCQLPNANYHSVSAQTIWLALHIQCAFIFPLFRWLAKTGFPSTHIHFVCVCECDGIKKSFGQSNALECVITFEQIKCTTKKCPVKKYSNGQKSSHDRPRLIALNSGIWWMRFHPTWLSVIIIMILISTFVFIGIVCFVRGLKANIKTNSRAVETQPKIVFIIIHRKVLLTEIHTKKNKWQPHLQRR